MWICEDDEIGLELKQEVEIVQPGGGSVAVKPPGYYVSRESGLFPAPLPQDNSICSRVADLFWFLGAFLAKTLQDNAVCSSTIKSCSTYEILLPFSGFWPTL